MPYTMKDFRRDLALEYLERLTLEERLQLAGLPAEKLVERLSPEQRLAGLPLEEIDTYRRGLRRGSPASRKKMPKRKRRTRGFVLE